MGVSIRSNSIESHVTTILGNPHLNPPPFWEGEETKNCLPEDGRKPDLPLLSRGRGQNPALTCFLKVSH
jgi:hypothetical protein